VTGAAAAPACVQCGVEATRTVGGRLLCDSQGCHQGPGTRNEDQDQGSTEGGRSLHVVPGPGVSHADPGKQPELLGLILDHGSGLLKPMPVELGQLPPVGSRVVDFKGQPVVVTQLMHTVADDIRLLLGLRLAVNEDRPLPYSARFCSKRCGLRDERQASRVLRALERVGVIECVGTMKPRCKPDGTKLYAAPQRGGT
jgi:hypothetical protein